MSLPSGPQIWGVKHLLLLWMKWVLVLHLPFSLVYMYLYTVVQFNHLAMWAGSDTGHSPCVVVTNTNRTVWCTRHYSNMSHIWPI